MFFKKLRYSIFSAAFFTTAFVSAYCILGRPVAEFEEAFASIVASRINSGESVDWSMGSFASSGARDTVLLARLKRFAKNGDLKNAIALYRDLKINSNRQVARAFINYKSYGQNLYLEAVGTPTENAVAYILRYVDSGCSDKFALDKAVEYVKKNPGSETSFSFKVITDIFESHGLYVENLRFFEKVAPIQFDISITNVEKYADRADIPTFAKNAIQYNRIRFFLPKIKMYRDGKVSKAKAREEIMKTFVYWSAPNRGKYVLYECFECVGSFLIELGYSDDAQNIVESLLYDRTSSKYMRMPFFVLRIKESSIPVLLKLGRSDMVESLVFTGQKYENRVRLTNVVLDYYGKNDFRKAEDYFRYINSPSYKLKLFYKK